jgi:hypothetical protein
MWSMGLTNRQRCTLARKLASGSQQAYEREEPELELELDALLHDLFAV